MQRQWRLSLAGIALLLALGQPPALAATIPLGGACTLVDALTAANTDTATGGCPAGSGADTLLLPAGSTQTLTAVNNSTYGPTGLPVISSAITIAGQGSTIARDPEAPEFRIVAVGSTGDLTLQETTVSGGVSPAHSVNGDVTFYHGGGVAHYGGILTVTHSTIAGNAVAAHYNEDGFCTGSGSGGGVYSRGTVTVTHSTITGNATGCYSSGGGMANTGTGTVTHSTIAGNSTSDYGSGGGVLNSGTLTITNGTITDNDGAYGGGGGVHNSGTLTITNSTIAGNSTSDYGDGGGVFNDSIGTVTVTNSTITGNATGTGGGVANFGSFTLTNSTITGNATRYLFLVSVGDGGGVVNAGTLTVTNSTITGNSADGGGGGIANSGTLTVINSTITGNSAGRGGGGVYNGFRFTGNGILTLARTLVTGNTAYGGGPEMANPGTVIADNHNLFGVDGTAGVEGFSPGATDIVPPAGVQLADILDPTLAFNGGLTQTHALVPGSPAIDAGGTDCTDANGDPLATDQRGRPPSWMAMAMAQRPVTLAPSSFSPLSMIWWRW